MGRPPATRNEGEPDAQIRARPRSSAQAAIAQARHAIRLDAYAPPVIGNVFRDNVVSAAGVNGIAINADQVGPVTDTVLDGNVAIGSSNDGIYVGSASTTLTRNLAMHNGNLGIEAVPGVIDGGGKPRRRQRQPGPVHERCLLTPKRSQPSLHHGRGVHCSRPSGMKESR
jgi:hypothetical protein